MRKAQSTSSLKHFERHIREKKRKSSGAMKKKHMKKTQSASNLKCYVQAKKKRKSMGGWLNLEFLKCKKSYKMCKVYKLSEKSKETWRLIVELKRMLKIIRKYRFYLFGLYWAGTEHGDMTNKLCAGMKVRVDEKTLRMLEEMIRRTGGDELIFNELRELGREIKYKYYKIADAFKDANKDESSLAFYEEYGLLFDRVSERQKKWKQFWKENPLVIKNIFDIYNLL